MNAREFTKGYRLRHWAELIRKREETGTSVKIFCESMGVHENRYYYWQKKLREAACKELMEVETPTSMVPRGFTEVKLQTQSIMSMSSDSTQNHVCIETGNVRINASSEYPIEKLTALLRTAVQL